MLKVQLEQMQRQNEILAEANKRQAAAVGAAGTTDMSGENITGNLFHETK